jgi:diguanylate cyclase (GGDEF)-like protein/PAS domain S-box-containing protein
MCSTTPMQPDGPPLPHSIDLSGAKRERFAVYLAVGNIVVIGLLFFAGWFGIKTSRQADEARAVEAAQNMAAGLAAEIAAELRLIDNALATAASAYRAGLSDEPGNSTIEKVLQQQKELLPDVDVVRLADADGWVRVGLPEGAKPVSIADRDYFISARQTDDLVVSEPLQDGIVKKWGIILAKRIENRDGSFGGVVYSNLSSEYFARSFSRLQIGKSGAISLRSNDLRLIARFVPGEPPGEKNAGSASVSQDLKDALKRHPIQGWYQTPTALDGIERITAYRKVPGYGLTILTGQAPRDFLAPWRRDVQIIGALLLLAGTAIVMASVGMYSQWRRNSLTERRIVDLVRQQEVMLDNDLIGIVRTKSRTTVWSNKAFRTIFGYGQDELDGHPSRLLYLDDASYERVGAEGYKHVLNNSRYRTQLKMRRKDGSPVWVDLSGMPVSADESMWMFVDITAMKEREDQLSQLALHDSLTGLANRTQFAERLRMALTQAKAAATLVAVCYIDLDGFKAVNDEMGHAAGDEVLVETSKRLLACVRSQDTVTRLGGDEFAIVLATVQDRRQVEIVLDRILATLREPIPLGDAQSRIRASIGVAYAPDHGSEPEQLMRIADEALYEAKRAGKDCYRVAM